MQGKAEFRRDIEGLRAVSILAVVLNHARVPGFEGGFVGVDIFFVISGFLICRLLAQEFAATGTIDLAAFWARRARRLLPNAVLTLLTVLMLALVIVPGYARPQLAREVVFAALYVSNYEFAAKSVDYFRFEDPPSPILHFWSLSVEEQFYIGWPLILVAVAFLANARAAIWHTAILAAIWVASLIACLILVRSNQPLAFFHTETRCWQLATGGLVAAYFQSGRRLPSSACGALSWAGAAAILGAIATLSHSMAYPGAWALLPTLGAAAMIAGGATGLTWPGRLLATPIMGWLGRRSYSWYLWHWPVLVLLPSLLPDLPHSEAVSLALSLALASLVFACIEDPIRRGVIWTARPARSLAGACAAITAVLVVAGGLAAVPHLGRAASPELIARLKAAAGDVGRNYVEKCHLDTDVVVQPECVYGDAAGKRTVVLFGDSHAAQWFTPVEAAARSNGWRLYAWTKSSCPSVDIAIWYPPKRAPFVQCDRWRELIMERLTGPERPDAVILSNLADYAGWVQDSASNTLLDRAGTQAAWSSGLRTVIDRLEKAGIAVVVLRDTPKANRTYMKCLEDGNTTACGRRRSQAVPRSPPELAVTSEIGARVRVLDQTDRICDSSSCPVVRDGIIVYRDYHHLTATFAATMADDFRNLLRELGRGELDGHRNQDADKASRVRNRSP